MDLGENVIINKANMEGSSTLSLRHLTDAHHNSKLQ